MPAIPLTNLGNIARLACSSLCSRSSRSISSKYGQARRQRAALSRYQCIAHLGRHHPQLSLGDYAQLITYTVAGGIVGFAGGALLVSKLTLVATGEGGSSSSSAAAAAAAGLLCTAVRMPMRHAPRSAAPAYATTYMLPNLFVPVAAPQASPFGGRAPSTWPALVPSCLLLHRAVARSTGCAEYGRTRASAPPVASRSRPPTEP